MRPNAKTPLLLAVASTQVFCLSCLMLLAVIPVTQARAAQQINKSPRVCFLTLDPGSLSSPSRFGAFFEGLHDLGYINGTNIVIDFLSADGHGERLPALAAECLGLNPDVIAVTTTPAAQAV